MADPVSSLKVNVGVSSESKAALSQLIANIKGVSGAFKTVDATPTKKAAEAVKELTAEHEKAEKASANFSERLSKENSQLSYVENSIRRVVEGTRFLVGGFLAIEALHTAKEIADVAAQSERLGEVLKVTAANFGIASATVRGYDNQIQNLGFTAEQSRQFLVKFIQANLDVTKAVQVAQLAQNLSVTNSEGESYPQVLERLTFALQSARPEILKHLGLTVDTALALHQYAAATGVVVSQLTLQQRAEAVTNAVLAEGSKYNGLYATSQQTVAGQLKELPQLVEKFKDSLGVSLLPAYLAIVQVATQLLKELGLTADESATNTDAATKLATVVRDVANAFKVGIEFLIEHRAAIELVVGAYVVFEGVIDPVRKLITGLKETFVDIATGVREFAAVLQLTGTRITSFSTEAATVIRWAIGYTTALVQLVRTEGLLAVVQLAVNDALRAAGVANGISVFTSMKVAIAGAITATQGYVVALLELASTEGVVGAASLLLSDALAVTGITAGITAITNFVRGLVVLYTTEGLAAVATRLLTGAVAVLDAALLSNPLGIVFLGIAAAVAAVSVAVYELLSHVKGLVPAAEWTDIWHAGLLLVKQDFTDLLLVVKALLTQDFTALTKLKFPSFKELIGQAKNDREDKENERYNPARTNSVATAANKDEARVRLVESIEAEEAANAQVEEAKRKGSVASLAVAEDYARASHKRLAEDQEAWDKLVHADLMTDKEREAETDEINATRKAIAQKKANEANFRAQQLLGGGGGDILGLGYTSADEQSKLDALKKIVEDKRDGVISPTDSELNTYLKNAVDAVKNPSGLIQLKGTLQEMGQIKDLSAETVRNIRTGVAEATVTVQKQTQAFGQTARDYSKEAVENKDQRTLNQVQQEQALQKIANEQLLTTTKEGYETGLVSLEDYFNTRRGILRENLNEELRVVAATVYRLQDELNHTIDPNARAVLITQINAENDKGSLAAAKEKGDQAAIDTEEKHEQYEIQLKIRDTEAETGKILGSYGATVESIKNKYDDLLDKTKQQNKAAVESAREAALFTAELEHQNKLFDLAKSSQKAIQDNQKARLEAANAAGTITPAEFQATSAQITQEQIQDLNNQRDYYESQIVQNERAKRTTQDNDDITRINEPDFQGTDLSSFDEKAEDLQTKIQGINTEIITLGTSIQTYGKQIRDDFAGDISTAISSLITESGHASDAILNLGKNFQKQIADIFAKNLAAKLTQSLSNLNPDGTPKLDANGKPQKSIFDSLGQILGLGAKPKTDLNDGHAPSKPIYASIVNLKELKGGAAPGESNAVVSGTPGAPGSGTGGSGGRSAPAGGGGGPVGLPPQATAGAGTGGSGGGSGAFYPEIGAGLGEAGGDLIGDAIADASTWKYSPARPIAQLQDRAKGRAIGGLAGAFFGLLDANRPKSTPAGLPPDLSGLQELAGLGGPAALEGGDDLTDLVQGYADGGDVDGNTDGVDSNGLPKQWDKLIDEIKPIFQSSGGSWEGLVNAFGKFGLGKLGSLFGSGTEDLTSGETLTHNDPDSLLGGSTPDPEASGWKRGGLPRFAAGMIKGPGTGTSDSILARVSNNEFITNAASTAKYLPLLHAINNDDMENLQSIAMPRSFASGGLPGGPVTLPSMGGAAPGGGVLQVQLHPDALNMSLNDWLQKSVASAYANR